MEVPVWVRREHILSLVVLGIPLLLCIPLLNVYAYARDFDIVYACAYGA
jgi:hypothetical protein